MSRNNLYVLIVILSAALGIAYVSKTKGGIDNIFAPTTDGWMKSDPGWDKMPKIENTPVVPQTPPVVTPPKTPPQQKPLQEQPQQPQRRRQPQNNCPPQNN